MPNTRTALAAVAEEIARLRVAYLASLPAQLDEMSALATRVADESADSAALEDLHHRLHKLAGSGGTFGLVTLGKRARRLEQTAKKWLSEGLGSVDAVTRSAFATDICALATTLTEAGNAEAAAPPALAPAPKMLGNKKVQVWLVDDDVPLGHELAGNLEQFGYSVRLFTRMEDLEAAEGDRPDVLVLDVMFPGEGINATEAVLERPALRRMGCPFLFISAHDDFESRARAARAGAAGYLLKPLEVPRLVDRLERIFDDRQATPYRVMIVDDDAQLAEHYRLVLTQAGMEADVLNQPDKVLDRVSAFRPELVLMDMNMPRFSGPELATVIRQHDEWIGLPIVYLSSETDLERQIAALGHGADDFLTKPISDARLASAVRVRVSRSRQLSDLMAKDSLTGLLKHSRIKEEIGIELARARRSGRPLSVVMADIDFFKRINDTHGHATGDRVIKAVAQLLKQRLRRTDLIGRYGGEEFAIALPDCDEATALDVMEHIREAFGALRFNQDGVDFNCTLSAGISCSESRPDDDGSELLVAADDALYEAKRGGRNQVRSAGEST